MLNQSQNGQEACYPRGRAQGALAWFQVSVSGDGCSTPYGLGGKTRQEMFLPASWLRRRGKLYSARRTQLR